MHALGRHIEKHVLVPSRRWLHCLPRPILPNTPRI